MDESFVSPPHVLIFPFPAQGHLNSMLKLAELLCLGGLQVTFLNSDYNHHRLLRYSGSILARFSRFPGFRFESISDGLPMEHPRSGEHIKDIFDGVRTTTGPLFREKMTAWCDNQIESSETPCPPLTCIIADGILNFAIDVAEEVGVPIILFRTASACSFWAYFCLVQLIEAGEIPFRDDDLDRIVTGLPAMEGFIRRRDLPSFFRANNVDDPSIKFLLKELPQNTKTHGLILNTFEDLEGPVLSQIRNHWTKTYAIGPLHQHLKSRLSSETTISQTFDDLWEEAKSCITWLDRQPIKSVIYVSFGSLVVVKKDELVEFWYGLVNSGSHFLWVIRSDCIGREDGTKGQPPTELLEETKKRGMLVSWAPQEQVLAHPAVGGFLTHSGWNSTLEGIAAGVPMICWPQYADQQINSRFVSHVWKLGIDMKDSCDRITIEKIVRNVMEEKRDELMKSADSIMKLAKNSISEGGSSHCNLISLIEDIRLLCSDFRIKQIK